MNFPRKTHRQFAESLVRHFPASDIQALLGNVDDDDMSIEAFAHHYFPHYFNAKPSSFHTWLIDELTRLQTARGQNVSVIAPRGAAKSTWSTFIYPLYCALYQTEPYIIITSDTGQQAKAFLDAIRVELETNELLAATWPDVCQPGRTWREDKIVLRNGVTIEALGTGTKLRGRRARSERPSLIIVDDPQNTEHIISPVQRERSWDWLMKDVCNAGGPGTNTLVLGTALHRECIVCRLEKTPGWKHHKFRSIIEWPERMDLWKNWEDILCDYDNPEREEAAEAYYQANENAMIGGSKVLWEDRFRLVDLMLKRLSIGPGAFNTEQQGVPLDPEAAEWPPDFFDHAQFWFDEWPERLTVKTLSLDPSKGKSDRHGDYSAFVRFGRDSRGVEYVEADLKRRDVGQIVADGVEHMRQFKPDKFGVETNVFQELFISMFHQEMNRQKVECTVAGLDNTTNKLVRIRRLTAPLAQRKIRFKRHSHGTQLLVQQLKDFPNGEYDDGPDACEQARRLAVELFNEGGRCYWRE